MSAVDGDDAATDPPADMPGDADNVGMGGPAWSYRQRRARGADRTYRGHIAYAEGEYGEKLRGELAAIIADLLHWVAARRDRDNQDHDHREVA